LAFARRSGTKVLWVQFCTELINCSKVRVARWRVELAATESEDPPSESRSTRDPREIHRAKNRPMVQRSSHPFGMTGEEVTNKHVAADVKIGHYMDPE
jgi:hypothetical protein